MVIEKSNKDRSLSLVELLVQISKNISRTAWFPKHALEFQVLVSLKHLHE